jgi:hypothetical protein
MISIVLKNSILIFLIILIFHFIIKNQMMDKLEKMRKLEISAEKPKSVKKVRFNNNNIKSKVFDVEEEMEKQMNCDDFNEDKKLKITIDDKMEELYKFVYDDDKAETNLKEFYSTNIKPELKTMNDIDLHHQEIKKEFKVDDNVCNFEVIGKIEKSDGLMNGIDLMANNNYSSL